MCVNRAEEVECGQRVGQVLRFVALVAPAAAAQQPHVEVAAPVHESGVSHERGEGLTLERARLEKTNTHHQHKVVSVFFFGSLAIASLYILNRSVLKNSSFPPVMTSFSLKGVGFSRFSCRNQDDLKKIYIYIFAFGVHLVALCDCPFFAAHCIILCSQTWLAK